MKKVMLVIASLGGGGAERAMTQLAAALVDEGVEVHLLTWAATSGDFYTVDSRVHRQKLGPESNGSGLVGRMKRGLSVVAALRSAIRSVAPDCVLSFIDQSNVLTLAAATGLPVRVVVAERIDPRANDTLGFGWALARLIAYQRAQLVVAQTDAVAVWMAGNWRVRTVVIPNILRPLPEPTIERQPTMISVGRLVPQKAFDIAIRAFAGIAQRYPEWKYVILGEGPCRAEWMDLCHQLGVSERVHFAGLVDNVEHWLAQASIAVQSSRFEGFPNAVMEAMAMGVATISTDCPSGPADLIEHMHNGVLVQVDDVQALAQAMDQLMSNPSLRQLLGLRAKMLRETLSPRCIMTRWNDALFGELVTSELAAKARTIQNTHGEER